MNHGGCGYRQLSEVWQCHIGTVLMLTAIKILLWVYVFNGSAILEHPRGEPKGAYIWFIWCSSFIRQWLLPADVDLIAFLQGPPGQKFPKPTSLLAARLPGLAKSLYSHYDLRWKATEWLGGKAGKEWKTARAKAYPERLCKVLAFCRIDHANTPPSVLYWS